MYFAILGRHPQLSLAEFELVPTTSLRRQGQLLFFETALSEGALLSCLVKLGGIVKRGSVTQESSKEVEKFFADVALVGVNEQKLGMSIKKLYGVKRFKLVDLISSDLDVKKEGRECIDLGGGLLGLVLGWQDIAHFEQIDFGKPASGMEVGMMPSKLAQILVNIGVATLRLQGCTTPYTIYDPFCGFGTTGLVANWLGYNFIGSDLVIDGAKKNGKWWKEYPGLSSVSDHGDASLGRVETLFTVFKHDVTQQFDHPVLQHVDVVVSEGRLGPVVSGKTRESELLTHAEKIKDLYRSFLTNFHERLSQVPLVFTIPHYSRLPEAIFPDIVTYAVTLGYRITDLGIYSRKGQEVCRQIVILKK